MDAQSHASQKDPLDLPPLSLQLILVQRISVKILHVPPRCFEPPALITGKLTTPLKRPHHFMMPMCQQRDNFPAHRTVKRLGILAASDGPVTKILPSSLTPYNFFNRIVFFDRILRRLLLVFVSSPLVFDVSTLCGLCDGPCFSLSSTSFSSVNKKKYTVHQIRKLLNQLEAGSTNYSSMETTIVFPPPRKRSDTGTAFDDQWHESQWQQDR